MSIVERVAELLEPIERTSPKPSASKPDLIERIANPTFDIAEFPGRERITQIDVDLRAVELKAKTTQPGPLSKDSANLFFRIDRNQLRRQSIITPDSERTSNAESFRLIKQRILANLSKSEAGMPANLVMVTSALPGEGKTFCAVNLAISMAMEMDRSVVLVDADVAQPAVPMALGVIAERGLLDILSGKMRLSEVLGKTDISNLKFLPAGTAHQHSTELLASEAMRLLLHELTERYHDRVIVFDSPPLLAASEASALAAQMGQIVIVVEAGKTSEAALKAALSRIETSNVAGLILNKGEDPGLRYHHGEYGKVAK
jgi:protein-tyrosine kinase